MNFLILLIHVIGLCNFVFGAFGFTPFFHDESKKENVINLSRNHNQCGQYFTLLLDDENIGSQIIQGYDFDGEFEKIRSLKENTELENQDLVYNLIPEAAAACRQFRQVFENSKVYNYEKKSLFLKSNQDLYNFKCENPLTEMPVLFSDDEPFTRSQLNYDMDAVRHCYNLEKEKSIYLVESLKKLNEATKWYKENIQKDKK